MPAERAFLFTGTFFFFFAFSYQIMMKRRTYPMNTVVAISTIFLCMLFGAIAAIGLKKDDRNEK